ncbi:MAG TPA: ABC transporter substrate-binding protein [Accumulibacter sp.]|uniref:ABC transporter substrate-binding protein n=1 Tax=Accumulibacter sp. TaxID=2053492 RepID=UPI002BE3B1D5|nr:ABC transporter substrate-binding protein [Accumulibacter sp.]HRD90456.1 ABC transporter substrate-binding protein [Accumulibacter sp.]
MHAQSVAHCPVKGSRCWRQLLLIATCLLGTLSCAPPEPVRIGFLGGLSGRVADLGIGGRNGAILAVEQRNRRGGINGRPIELIAEDDQQDPEVAKQAVARLIARPVEVIIGPMTSAMAIAVVPQINATTIPLIAPTVTTNALTGIDDQFFRVVAPTARHVFKSAEYHYQERGLRRVLLVCDLRNKAYAESWAGDFRRAFVALGGTVVGEIGFTEDDALSTLAARALASRPDGVLIVANSVDTGLLVQQIRLRDRKVQLATAEWAATERLIELGGQAVEGVVVAQYVDRQNATPAYLAFRQAYRERFAHEPGFAGLTAFDATNVALDALTSRQKQQTLKQALLAHGDFVGAQSLIRFDANGDTERDTFLSRIHDGEFQSLP